MNKNTGIRKFLSTKSFPIITVLVIVIIGTTIMNKNFLSRDNIKLILFSCALSGMISVGVGCVLVSGNMDLSCAAVGCMSGILITFVLNAGVPFVLALIVVLAFGAVIGLFNSLLSFKLKLMPFIVTLSTLSILQGLGNVVTNNATVMNTNQSFWQFCGGTLFGIIPYSFIYFCILAIIYGFILSSTKFGRKIYMVGGNRSAARLAGISIEKMGTIIMVNNSVIAAFAGAIVSGRMHSGDPAAIHGTQLTAITAVVMGGVAFGGGGGGMLGAFFGILLLSVFNNALTVVGLGSYWQIFMSGVLLICALMLDLLNTRRSEKALKLMTAAAAQ